MLNLLQSPDTRSSNKQRGSDKNRENALENSFFLRQYFAPVSEYVSVLASTSCDSLFLSSIILYVKAHLLFLFLEVYCNCVIILL